MGKLLCRLVFVNSERRPSANGSNLKEAKLYNNCIAEPLFDIPIENVRCNACIIPNYV